MFAVVATRKGPLFHSAGRRMLGLRALANTTSAGNGWHSSSGAAGIDGAAAQARRAAHTEAFDPTTLVRPGHEHNNITANVASHLGRGLLRTPNHPLQIIKTKIFDYFDEAFPGEPGTGPVFQKFDDLHPVVSTTQAFDELRIPADHVSRSISDTFYVDKMTCLRPHTSAHQTDLMRQGNHAFLCAGDVYRRDEIDQSHYPVFHQMEGLYLIPRPGSELTAQEVEDDLKRALEGLVKAVFGEVKMRWVDAYFPFTEPSLELEIWFNDEWLEVLGAGVIHEEVLARAGLQGHKGWAFGLGLERLAMVLFDIPDIRLFWSTDSRFSEQFRDGEITSFKPFSKFPPCLKDISFWIPEGYHENDFYSLVRDMAGDLIERVQLIDSFSHPKTGRDSHCYRITYRSMERSLTNEEIDALQEKIRETVARSLAVELR